MGEINRVEQIIANFKNECKLFDEEVEAIFKKYGVKNIEASDVLYQIHLSLGDRMTEEDQKIDQENYVKEQKAIFKKYDIEDVEMRDWGLDIISPDRWNKLTDKNNGLDDFYINIRGYFRDGE